MNETKLALPSSSSYTLYGQSMDNVFSTFFQLAYSKKLLMNDDDDDDDELKLIKWIFNF